MCQLPVALLARPAHAHVGLIACQKADSVAHVDQATTPTSQTFPHLANPEPLPSPHLPPVCWHAKLFFSLPCLYWCLTSALFDVLFKAFDLLCALSMRSAGKITHEMCGRMKNCVDNGDQNVEKKRGRPWCRRLWGWDAVDGSSQQQWLMIFSLLLFFFFGPKQRPTMAALILNNGG